MTDIVGRLRRSDMYEHGSPLEQEAADEIERLRTALFQYQDDLRHPPMGASLTRRLEMIERILGGEPQ